MTQNKTTEYFVKVPTSDMLHVAQALIAASSILVATADQYAHTGSLSVGAIVHASNVIDNVIERLGLAELAIEQSVLPF